ncbi:MAG: cytochrome c maturation protein CcmE [Nitrospirales bacterium]
MPLLPASSVLVQVADLVSNPHEYDKKQVTVSGLVSRLQVATNRYDKLAYAFLLQDDEGHMVKVVGLGKLTIHNGERVVVEGTFHRVRFARRGIIANEITATTVRSLDRFHPDLVG